MDITNPLDFVTFDSLPVRAGSSAGEELQKATGASVVKAFIFPRRGASRLPLGFCTEGCAGSLRRHTSRFHPAGSHSLSGVRAGRGFSEA